jgi:hypothetical protein
MTQFMWLDNFLHIEIEQHGHLNRLNTCTVHLWFMLSPDRVYMTNRLRSRYQMDT